MSIARTRNTCFKLAEFIRRGRRRRRRRRSRMGRV